MTSDISSCASHSPFIPSRPVVAVLKDALTNGTDNYQAELLQIEDAVKMSGYGGDDALQVSRDLVSCIEKDDKRLEECLRKLLNIVEPFDVASMMKVFISSKDSINAAKGKHVVVIAGRTGTGKTVTLHYLSGSKLEKNQQRKVVVVQAAAGTEGCKVGSGSSSCTAYLQSVPCVADANVVLLDTVGWGDTKGDEIEAACNAVLGAALRECASVRFLLIIDSGFAYERCKPLKATIKDFCNLVNPTHLNDVVKCTTFGITRFKAEPFVDECIADVEELFSSNGNLTNNEKLICKLLTGQLESGIQIIDPEREWSKSPKEVLEAVLKSEPLRTPESAFRVPLSQDLRQKLGHQLQVYNEAVQRLLESSDHERAVEIIEIIKKLRMMFDDSILLKTMNECLRKVERMVSDILKKASRNLDSYFAKYPQYVVTPETIIQNSREVQGLRRYFAESFPDIGWDEVNVEQQAEQYVESVHMGTPEEMGTAVRKCRELMGLGMLSVDKSLSLVHDNIRKQFNSFSKNAIVGIDEMSSVKEMIKQLEACCQFASIADGSCSYKEVVERFSDKLEDKLMSAKLAVEKLPVGNEALSGLLDFLMRVTEKQEKLKELQVEVKYLERGLRNLGDHVEEIFKKATSTMGGADAEMYLSIGKVLERSWGHDYQSRKESSFVQVECAVQKFLDGDVSDVYRCIRSVGHPLACDADLAGSFVWNQKCERTWDHLSKLQKLVELVRGVLPLTAAMVEKRLIAPRIDDLGKLCDGIEKTLEGPMGRVHCLEEVRDKYIAADPRLLLLQKLGVLGDIVDCESDDAQKILNDRRERMQNKIINIEKGITAVGEKLDSRRNLFDDSNIETAEEANDIIDDFDMRIPKAEGKLRSLESLCNQCKSQKRKKLDANGYKNITELRKAIQDEKNEVDQMISQREEYVCVLKELANINKIPAEVDPEMHQGLGLEEVLTRLKNQLDEHQRQQRDVDAQLKVLKNDVVSREAASVLREARISSVFDLVTELRDKKMEARESTYTELGSEGLQELETVLDANVEFRRAAVLRDDLIRRAKSVAERKAFEAVKSIKEVCNMIIDEWKSESAVQVVQLVDDVFRFFNSMPEVYKRHSFDKLREPLMGALETVRNLRFNDDPDRLFFARSCYVIKLLSESTAVEVRNMFDPLYKKSEQDLEDMLEHSMPEKIDEAELDIVEEKLALYGQLDAAHRATFKSQNVKKNLLAKVKKQLDEGIVAVPGSDSAFFREMREGQRQLRIAKRVKELLSESQAKQLVDVCNRMREHFSSLLWEKLKSMNTSGESCVKLSEKLEMFSEFRDLMTEEVALDYERLHKSERTVTDDILEALVENDPLEWRVNFWRDLKRMEAEGLNRETERKISENIRKTYLDKILDETLVTKLRKMKDHLPEMGTFEHLADELKDKLDDYTSKLDQEQSSAKGQVLLAVKHDNYEILWNTDSKLPRRSIVNEMNDLLRDEEEKYMSGETLSCSDVLLALHCKELAGDSNVPAMRLMRQACNSDFDNKNWKGILFWVTCLYKTTNNRDHTFIGKFLESCGLPPVLKKLKRSFSDLKESMNGVLRDNTFTHLEHISDKWNELENICETLATVWKQSSGLPDGIPCAEILKSTGSVVPEWSKWKDDVVKKVNENQQNIAEKGSELVNSFLATQDSVARKQLNEELTKSITALQSITTRGADVVGLAAVPEIKNILSKEITKLREKAIKGITEKDWVKVNQIIESLSALRDNAVSFVADAACPVSAEVRKAATDKLGEYIKLQHTDIVECLIGMQQMSDSVEMLRVVAQKHISTVLESYVKSYGPKKLPELVESLRSHKSGIGELLVTEHQIFKSFSIQLWKERAGKRDIKDVMEDLHQKNPEMSKDEISKLRKAHDFVMEKTESYIREHYLGGNSAVEQLVKKTKQMGFDIANKNVIRKFAELFLSNDGLLDLVAHVSAIWTLKGSDRGSKESEFLRKLHSIQVLAIVRSLGSKTFLEGSFVQVSTGEGKSVVLSILAAVCSLLGITPYVVCHSSYLSTRDEDDSSDFLKELDVGAFYGTINQCCEDVLRGKALREAGEGLLNGDKPQVTQLDRVKRILLIDEVDVFMSESFYGQVYLPSMKRSAADLKPLTDFLWENKDNEEKMKWNQVRVLKEFEDAAAALSICGNLFNEAVRSMIEDLKYFKKASDYVVTKEDDGSLKIGYVEQDCIDYTRVDEYRTLWAIYEAYHGDDTIDEETREYKLRQEVYLLFKLGEYSYMDLARDEFSNIIGVSGTLPQSSSEKDIVKDLGIKYQTVMPSMYGPSNLKFDERNDVQAEESGEVHYSVVLREIKMRLGEGKRSVLVLFESEQQIGDYMKRMEKTEDEKTLRSIQRMVEGNTHSERMARTKRATTPGVVTFAVRVLGRGTDFYVTMESMLAAGGMHVIQTFMGSMSEHLQIKGRTARQGQVGSFSMIIDIGGLDTFGISRSVAMEQTKNKTLYKFLCDASTDHHTKMLQLQIIDAKGSTKEHRHSMDFRSELLRGKLCKKSFVDKLLKWNKGPKYEKATSRTVILLDGTGSMSNLIHGAKAVLREVFERIYFILEEADNSLLSFSIQIVVYRSYNWKLLQVSKWCDTAGDLCGFLQDVKAEGGYRNEAVEVGLNHVNNEDNVTQVILMGDAPASTDEDLTYLASAYKVTTTDWKTETRALADKEIPVHSFYLAPWAKENFNEISSMTSGECKRLDVSSSSAADEMTDLWSLRVLEDIGGDVLVSQYRKRYASHTS